MTENNDEATLRRRMREVRIEEVKREFGKKPDTPILKFKGLSPIAIAAIALTALFLLAALTVALLPPT